MSSPSAHGLGVAFLAVFAGIAAMIPGEARAQDRELAVVSGDVTLRARAIGPEAAKTTLVVVHGGPALDAQYLAGLSWLAAPDRRIVFYDQRGAGASTRSARADYGLAAQVADLEAVRESVGADRIHLVAHSWGTVVALAYTGAHPDAVASLILIGMGAPTASSDRRSFAARFAERKAVLIREGVIAAARPAARGDDCMSSFDAILPVHFADARHPGARHLAGTYHCDVGRLTTAGAGEWDFRGLLGSLRVPALLVIGDADANFAGARETARLIGPERLAWGELRACGHFPWIECPEPFFATLIRFLSLTNAD
jgi:pimeloyl-ACP methyl ester carboxylesterase